jgi:hypothetical protein
MKFLVTFEVFDTIIGDDVAPLRKAFAKQLDVIVKSGKLVTGGMIADKRGGFFVVEADSGAELMGLLGEGMLDHCHVESHAIYEFEELIEFFKKTAPKHGK